MFVRSIAAVRVADVVANFNRNFRIVSLWCVCVDTGLPEFPLSAAVSYIVDLFVCNELKLNFTTK